MISHLLRCWGAPSPLPPVYSFSGSYLLQHHALCTSFYIDNVFHWHEKTSSCLHSSSGCLCCCCSCCPPISSIDRIQCWNVLFDSTSCLQTVVPLPLFWFHSSLLLKYYLFVEAYDCGQWFHKACIGIDRILCTVWCLCIVLCSSEKDIIW